MNSMYQKEFENIINLVCNKHSPSQLIKHVISENDFIKSIIENTVGCSFEFESGKRIQTGLFASLCEISNILRCSENASVRQELENQEKWDSFNFLFIDPIIQRFKEGLILPQINNLEFTSFDNLSPNTATNSINNTTTTSTVQDKEVEIMVKPSINSFLNQLHDDYYSGKKAETTKKDEMEIVNDEEEDHYYIHNDIDIHQGLLHQYGSEKPHIETHEFYDNNYWSSKLVVDELDLSDLLGKNY